MLDVIATWCAVAVVCLILGYVAVRVEWGRLADLFNQSDLKRRRRAWWSSVILPWATYGATIAITAALILFFGDQLGSACVLSDPFAVHCATGDMFLAVVRDGLWAAIGSSLSALFLGIALIRLVVYYALGYGIPFCTAVEGVEHFWHNVVHASDLFWLQVAYAVAFAIAAVFAAVTGQGVTRFVTGRICR